MRQRGAKRRSAAKHIANLHNQGINVLLIYCQPVPSQLFNTALLNDVAQAGADAVQCGNEQMNSWHDGLPGLYINNLMGLFSFWARQFGVSLGSPALGQHLWVVEDTGSTAC